MLVPCWIIFVVIEVVAYGESLWRNSMEEQQGETLPKAVESTGIFYERNGDAQCKVMNLRWLQVCIPFSFVIICI